MGSWCSVGVVSTPGRRRAGDAGGGGAGGESKGLVRVECSTEVMTVEIPVIMLQICTNVLKEAGITLCMFTQCK